jgi:hypothetical protein
VDGLKEEDNAPLRPRLVSLTVMRWHLRCCFYSRGLGGSCHGISCHLDGRGFNIDLEVERMPLRALLGFSAPCNHLFWMVSSGRMAPAFGAPFLNIILDRTVAVYISLAFLIDGPHVEVSSLANACLDRFQSSSGSMTPCRHKILSLASGF